MGRENNSDMESDSAIYSVDCRNIPIVTTSTTSSEEEKERQKGKKKIGTKEGQRKKKRTRRQHGCFSREQNNLRHLTPHGCKKQGGREGKHFKLRSKSLGVLQTAICVLTRFLQWRQHLIAVRSLVAQGCQNVRANRVTASLREPLIPCSSPVFLGTSFSWPPVDSHTTVYHVCFHHGRAAGRRSWLATSCQQVCVSSWPYPANVHT